MRHPPKGVDSHQVATHRLLGLLVAAARGEFPPADGGVDVLEAPAGRVEAVVAFTAHHVIATTLRGDEVRAQLPRGDIGAPMRAPFLTWLGQRLDAPPGMVDLVLAADPRHDHDAPSVVHIQEEASEHPRILRANRYRDDVRVYSDPQRRGVMAIGRGLAGRLEVTIEVDPVHRGQGVGRELASAARRLTGEEPVFAQVSPGNSASLRAFAASGYRPIGGEVLFLRRNDELPDETATHLGRSSRA